MSISPPISPGGLRSSTSASSAGRPPSWTDPSCTSCSPHRTAALRGAGIAKRSFEWQRATPTIDVADADAATEAIEAEGGTILIPKTSIPGVGELVTFRDPEGNVMAALQATADNPFAPPRS